MPLRRMHLPAGAVQEPAADVELHSAATTGRGLDTLEASANAMLRILDRYVIKEVLAPFFLALALFTFILLVDPLMREAQRLIEKGVGAWTILRILGTLMPQALGVTIPVSLLVGLLIGLGRLSADR